MRTDQGVRPRSGVACVSLSDSFLKLASPLLLLLLAGCTHTRPADFSSTATRAEISARVDGGQAIVYFEDGRKREVRSLEVGTETTTGVDRRSDEAFVVPTSGVTSVAFLRDGFGALEGAAIGAAVGIVVVHASCSQTPDIVCFQPLSTIVGTVIGGIPGAIVGLFRSDRVVYEPVPPAVGVLKVAPAPCAGIPLACAAGLEGGPPPVVTRPTD